MRTVLAVATFTVLLGACSAGSASAGSAGQAGLQGPQGPQGPPGPAGPSGVTVVNGTRLLIQTYTVTSEDGSKFAQPGGYYDTKLHVTCYPNNTLALATDNAWRCTPTPGASVWEFPYPYYAPYSQYFSDSTCTTHVTDISSCNGTFSYGHAFVSGPRDTCTGLQKYVDHYWELTPYSGPLYSTLSGSCAPLTASSGNSWYFYREMQPSEFVTMTVTTQ